jgi:hypothetical protein
LPQLNEKESRRSCLNAGGQRLRKRRKKQEGEKASKLVVPAPEDGRLSHLCHEHLHDKHMRRSVGKASRLDDSSLPNCYPGAKWIASAAVKTVLTTSAIHVIYLSTRFCIVIWLALSEAPSRALCRTFGACWAPILWASCCARCATRASQSRLCSVV